jgi:hypothetical protein
MAGAIHKLTGIYTLPNNASKDQEYICPDTDCRRNVMLKKGKIKIPHFAHYSESGCSHYNEGESSAHKFCKTIIRNILENKRNLTIYRNCDLCGDRLTFAIDVQNIVDVKEEYPLGNQRRADVGCLMKDNSILVFEVFHTHRTSEFVREGTWFELHTSMINFYKETGDLIFECNRDYICVECKDKAIQLRKKYEEEQKQRILQKERERKEYEERERQRLEQIEINRKELQEKYRKEREEREAQDRKRMEDLEKERKIREEKYKQKLEFEAQKRKEHEDYIEQLYKLYLEQVVKCYKYNPKDRPAEDTYTFMGHEFLHPHHIYRMNKGKSL